MLRHRYVIKDTQWVYFVPLLFSLRLLSPLCSLYAVRLPAVWSEFIPSLFSPGVCCPRSSRPSPSGVPHLQSQIHRCSVCCVRCTPLVHQPSVSRPWGYTVPFVLVSCRLTLYPVTVLSMYLLSVFIKLLLCSLYAVGLPAVWF